MTDRAPPAPTAAAAPPRAALSGRAADGGGGRVVLAVFLGSLLIPISLNLAGMRLDPYRIVLLLCLVPFGLAWLNGRAGRITGTDLALLAHVLWIVATLILHHGPGRLPFAGMNAIELFGGYLAGRMLIRCEEDYRRFIRFYLVLLGVVAPLALIELVTGRMPHADLLSRFFEVQEKIEFYRLDLSRVQAGFPHAILYGLFCSLIVANVFYLYRDRMAKMLGGLGLGIGMTLLALSSAPVLSILLQVAMAVWDRITRGNWWLLLGLFAAAYLFLEVAANRAPVIILISYLTLDPQTGWYRVLIWDYGSAEVLRHPLFGIGLNDWTRPFWMVSGTVDNFWLLTAMRHGLPGLGFLVLAIVLHARGVLSQRGLSHGETQVRKGHMVAMTGLFLTLATVHIWDELAVFVMFYIGAGAFLYTGGRAGPETAAADTSSGAPATGRTPGLRRAPPPAPAARAAAPPLRTAPGLRRTDDSQPPGPGRTDPVPRPDPAPSAPRPGEPGAGPPDPAAAPRPALPFRRPPPKGPRR